MVEMQPVRLSQTLPNEALVWRTPYDLKHGLNLPPIGGSFDGPNPPPPLCTEPVSCNISRSSDPDTGNVGVLTYKNIEASIAEEVCKDLAADIPINIDSPTVQIQIDTCKDTLTSRSKTKTLPIHGNWSVEVAPDMKRNVLRLIQAINKATEEEYWRALRGLGGCALGIISGLLALWGISAGAQRGSLLPALANDPHLPIEGGPTGDTERLPGVHLGKGDWDWFRRIWGGK